MLLAQLKKALEPLVELSRAEIITDVLGTEVHLRLLSPDEELACQQEAQQYISDTSEEDEVSDVSRTKALRFLDGFRLSILSRAVVQINELDLRGVEFLETGEELKNGVKIKILKTQAVREIVAEFPRGIQVHLMQKFHILTESVSVVVTDNLEGSFSDEDAEVQSMEEELQRKKNTLETKKKDNEQQDVRKMMRTTANQTESFVSERMNTAEDIEKASKEAFQKQEETLATEESEPEAELEAEPTQRTPITPVSANPPTIGQQPPPSRSEHANPTPTQKEPVISQEQEMPVRKAEPVGLQNGVEVYRLNARDR